MDPKRVIIACQGSPTEKFLLQMENLFKSLELNGGSLKQAKRLAVFSEPIESKKTLNLNKLNVRIKISKDLVPDYLFSNKIRMLELGEYNDDYDFLVALDTDILINRDFSNFLKNGGLSASFVRSSKNSMQQWNKIFKYFGLELSTKKNFSSITKVEIPPLFNSGVLIIPQKYTSLLYTKWKKYVLKLIKSYNEIEDNFEPRRFIDQIGLSLAIIEGKIPYISLPIEMNFPTRPRKNPDFFPTDTEPYLFHYHNWYKKDGNLRLSPYVNINKFIDKINCNIKNFQL